MFLAVAALASPNLVLERLAELGARDAMMLDGGGSSAMAIGEGAEGVASGLLFGGSRPVATFFGVRARRLGAFSSEADAGSQSKKTRQNKK